MAAAEPARELAGEAAGRSLAAFRRELVAFVRRRVPDESAAEDIVQDVFAKVLGRRDGLRDPRKLRAWLFQITRNAMVDHFRAVRPLEPLPPELPIGPAEDRRAEQELAGCLRPLLETLPTAYASAVRRVELEGATQRSVAAALGISVSGVKSRVQRGRRMLFAALLRCCEIERSRAGGIAAYECRETGRECGCRAPESG